MDTQSQGAGGKGEEIGRIILDRCNTVDSVVLCYSIILYCTATTQDWHETCYLSRGNYEFVDSCYNI